jgi:hypothetical protein
MSKAIKITVVNETGSFRKWDTLYIIGRTVLVVAVADKGNTANLTLYPYKKSKNKTVFWLRFKWIKLMVFLKIIR